jgi:cardiolipin synthase A/B
LPVKLLLDKIDHGFTWIFRGREPRRPRDPKKPRNYKTLSVLALIALVIQSGIVFLALFEPGLPYKISRAPAEDLRSDHFIRQLEALTQSRLYESSAMEVLTNGENYYEAELEAIRQAKASINLEAYIFKTGEVGNRFISAISERARAGVQVNVLVDAIGSFTTRKSEFEPITNHGGQFGWYHPIRWHSWHRLNNRTHRELLIIDGNVGFIGGAGWADHWAKGTQDDPRWRDTMVRVDGEAVAGLQSVFAQNWLEASGEILTGYQYFPFIPANKKTAALIVGSSPTTGKSTTARVLFQTLLASANKSIYITTPYFLPDNSARNELVRAVKERGVDVKIVVPGDQIDHQMTRSSSRRLYGDILEAGGQIHEYQASMMHAKILIIDGIWSVVGSTNFDSRSFGINDEVNMAVLDQGFANRLTRDFEADLQQSRLITYEQWKRRPHIERAQEWFWSLLERQQ